MAEFPFSTNFDHRDFTSQQLLTFGGELGGILKDDLIVNYQTLKDLKSDFATDTDHIRRRLAIVRKKDSTKTKADLDDVRDNNLVAIKLGAQATSRWATGELLEQAELVLEFFNRRKSSFQDLTYRENSAELDLWLDEFDGGKNERSGEAAKATAGIDAMHLRTPFDGLAQAHADFKAEEVKDSDAIDSTEDADLPAMRKAKENQASHVRLLLSLGAYYVEFRPGDGPWADLMARVDDRIADMRRVAANRETRGEGDGDEEVTG
ncbi:MAG: hypothetical protein ACI8UO_003512 [Verrucomicrobiales bacterium]|jgi:hypothetical protein